MAVEVENIRDQIATEIAEFELFHTFRIDEKRREEPTYVTEGFDREKIEAEGSVWIVYVYDCIRRYYWRHRDSIEDTVDNILREALKCRP